MSSDIFEKNVSELIRRGALPLDAKASARAKARFQEAVDAPPERISWKIAAAAAAVLVIATVVWSARSGRPAEDSTQRRGDPPAVSMFVTSGGNDLLKGSFTMSPAGQRQPVLRFQAQSPLPEGLCFRVRLYRMEEQFAQGRLSLSVRETGVSNPVLHDGRFDEEWAYRGPGAVRLDVVAPDASQDTSVMKRLKVAEAERIWTFDYHAWDERIYSRLGPQLAEIAELARETRELVAKFEEASASEELFKDRKKELLAAAERLQARAEGISRTGLYPASASQIAFVARDLVTSMQIFTWEQGKFAGPKSYYTNGEKGKDSRQAPFEFPSLRRYLDEAVAIGGRELVLWTLKDIRRTCFLPQCMELLQAHSARPGVAEFAPRLLDGSGVKLEELEAEVRAVSK